MLLHRQRASLYFYCPHCLKKFCIKAQKRNGQYITIMSLRQKLYLETYPRLKICVLADSLDGTIAREYPRKGKVLTDLAVNLKNASEFANAGRGRWCIENRYVTFPPLSHTFTLYTGFAGSKSFGW